jgi:hypothetical protein
MAGDNNNPAASVSWMDFLRERPAPAAPPAPKTAPVSPRRDVVAPLQPEPTNANQLTWQEALMVLNTLPKPPKAVDNNQSSGLAWTDFLRETTDSPKNQAANDDTNSSSSKSKLRSSNRRLSV